MLYWGLRDIYAGDKQGAYEVITAQHSSALLAPLAAQAWGSGG